MKKQYNVAILGASGAVGQQMIRVLEERDFPVGKLLPLASARSAGKTVEFRGQAIAIEEAAEASFKGMDFVLGAVSNPMAQKFAPAIVAAGAVFIDNSSAFRMADDVPLVVPEINPEDALQHHGIIANPNCSTIQAMVALKPLQDKYGIKRVVYSTYQAVSGSGVKGINDLKNGLAGDDEHLQAYAHPIAGNCLPHIDVFTDNGYTKEEMKMINETHKILGDDDIKVTATTVRVPVFDSHSESINIELEKPFELEDVVELFKNSPGIVVQDDVAHNVYPLARDAAGTDAVYIGRIRRDFSVDNGLNIWVVADNIRKGAATNAIQIAEKLVAEMDD